MTQGPGITLETEPYFKNGMWGWDGTQWRKINLVWAFYDTVAQSGTIASAAAGLNTIQLTAVPTGYVYVINGVGMTNATSGCTGQPFALKTAIAVPLGSSTALAAGFAQFFGVGSVVLKAGDSVVGYFVGCTLGDVLTFTANGYMMRINQ